MPILADVMVGIEPWLNETTACTFPEPFFEPFTRNTKQHYDAFHDYEPQASDRNYDNNEKSTQNQKTSNLNLRQYEGTFGNFARDTTSTKLFPRSFEPHYSTRYRVLGLM